MYWADELAAAVAGPQVVNDSKSPSGTVHVGSLRGVVLHDAIHRALLGAGLEAKFLYGVDDMDAMDSAALLTPDAVERYMGAPLSRVPAPEGSSAANYARHFVGEIFFRTFEPLGIRPEFYWVSELYAAGRMDPYIRLALDRADRVRDIYRRVSHVERPSEWLPIQVICEDCGRIGTTYATDWDGATVAYQCKPDLVSWARGCGHEGRVSPLGGRAKLPWNLEWAAKWGLLGVTIEGCGKDLATAGGSRDRSDAISREVFEVEPPRNVAYEFLNVGGKKMSTSRGPGRGGPHRRRGPAAGAAPFPLPAAAAQPGHRVRPGGRHDPAPLRRVRPDRRRHGRARGQGRAAGRPRPRLRLLAGRRLGHLRVAGRRRGRRRLPARLRAPGAAAADPRRRHSRTNGGRKGRPAERAGDGDSD